MAKLITKLNAYAKSKLENIPGYLEINGKIVAYNNKKEAVAHMRKIGKQHLTIPVLGSSSIGSIDSGLSIIRIGNAPVGKLVIKWIRGKKTFIKTVETNPMNNKVVIIIKKSRMLLLSLIGLGWKFVVKVK